MFRGEIGNLNLPVLNAKKQISPQNTAKFHRDRFSRRKDLPIKRLNFPLAGEISRWFSREIITSDQRELCKNGF